MTEFLSYGFIQLAVITGILVGILCSVLGVLLVLRRMSLVGDGLAHVSFGSVALGLLFGQDPVFISIPVVVVSSACIMHLVHRARIHGDAAIGIVSALGLASGVMIAHLSGGFNVDLFSYLFGNILSVTPAETILSATLTAVVLFLVFLFYHEFFSLSFDEEYAGATGIPVHALNLLLAVLTSVTVVLSIRVVGILLTSSLLIIPAVTAIGLARGFALTIILSAALSVTAVIAGITASFFFNLPTGASIVIVSLILFIISLPARTIIPRKKP